MKLLTGQVKSVRDFARRGVFIVKTSNKLVEVIYTSPFGSEFTVTDGKSGFFAIPGKDSHILFAKSDTSPFNYYYISTIHQPPYGYTAPGTEVSFRREHGYFAKKSYNREGVPDRVTIMDREGNMMQLNHVKDKTDKSIICGVELKSRDGKTLLLNDSPKAYGIYLVNERSDGITIGSDQKDGHTAGDEIAPRQIDIKTKGKITVTSKTSSIDVRCQNGQDINIRNESVGLFNFITLGLLGAPYQMDPSEPYGNVRITSQLRDIYVEAGDGNKALQKKFGQRWSSSDHKSRVMIRSLGDDSLVQIMSDGSIIIKATNGNLYIHGKSINIKGEDSVSIQSKGDINMTAGGSIKMTAQVTDSSRPATFADDAAEQQYDAGQSAISDNPSPTGNGHITLSNSVTVNGSTINLAPTSPPVRATKALHPAWELGDYDKK